MDLYTLLKKSKIHFKESDVFNHEVNHIEDNSKKIEPNTIFVAIRGEIRDGHDYIREVVQNNIKTIVYEDPYYSHLNFENVNMIKVHDSKKALAILSHYFYNHSSNINLIGVTGTNGKTTIVSMIYQLFHLLNKKCSLIGTNGIRIGKEKLSSKNTTPSSLMINKMIHESFKNDINNLVMEVSSHAIKQERVAQLDFNTVIFTNLSHDHLDYHKTFDDYFYSKGLLFAYLGNFFNEKKVLFNGDDKYYKKFLRITNVESYTYGIGTENDFEARNIVCDVDKIHFDFYAFNELIGDVQTKDIFGFFNVYNILAITSYFYIHDYDMNEVFKQMNKLQGVTGRMQKVINDYGLNIFIDYAHTPDSVYRILSEIKIISKKKIICVIGCGGDRDALKRPIIGKITTNLCDKIIFTTDNPRHEEPSRIIHDIVQGASGEHYTIIEDRSEAIFKAVQIATEENVVVILGKGHEQYQVIHDKKNFFSDFKEVEKAIHSRFNT